MCEVVKSNFKELYPSIEKSLKKAAFIAIDSEFSGLVSHSKLKNSLFDTSAERYLKLKCNIEQFTIFQFGLAIFHYDRDDNQYTADVYSFYTFPCSFGPVDNRFLCQATSWEFLRAHNFNFNKVAYEGIPFLNESQERLIRQQLKAGTMFTDVERSLEFREEDALQAACSRVSQWLALSGDSGRTLELPVADTEYCLRYFMHKEVRRRFRDTWTFSEPGKIVVRRMTVEEVSQARESEVDQLDQELLDSLLGFTKVFRLLAALKKPILGHNLLLDLMILYNQMYEPLPASYADFKRRIHYLFPSIYDTKYISYRVKDILKKQDCWSSNTLDRLYMFCDSSQGRALASCSPTVKVRGQSNGHIDNVETHVHEAAWDAYMCGYCFIRLAHFLATRRMGEEAISRPLSRTEHLSAVQEYLNRVNIIRGSVSHMNFGGEEPMSNRPKQLLLRRRDGAAIDIDQVTALMASHGLVDVKALSETEALIAVPNITSARNIVRAFYNDKNYKIVMYSSLVHGAFKTAIWSTVVIAGSVCVFGALKTFLIKK